MKQLEEDYASAKSLSFEDTPIIDLDPLLQKQGIEGVAKQLMVAALNTGFFYIKNHGIDQLLIDNAFKASQSFFNLTVEEKQLVSINQQQRGWLAPGMAKFTEAKTHDLKEIFFYGPEYWSEKMLSKRSEIPLIARNQWPEDFPEFQECIIPYYNAVCSLGHHVLSAIAVGLGEKSDFFAKRYTSPLGRGQLVYYPRSEKEDEVQQRFGAAAHTDFGVLTLLYQDDNGGLQVFNKSEQWVEAPPILGTFVCNIGDLLNRWTNGLLSSNLHRVINRSGNERFSMPVFFDPDPDAIINSKDFKQFANQPSSHSPIQVSDYIDGKNRKTFSQYKE
jgi:isopenicillin N synthase-like dioxygenase